jgi:uncharacterized RDD family membrane protein YckC
MTYRPPTPEACAGLEDAAFPAPRPAQPAKPPSPVRIAAFVVLLLLISLLAVAVFLGITVGVTILVGDVLPRPVNLAAPIAGVAIASLCFGGASRFRPGTLKGRYGLLRRPPRDPQPQPPPGGSGT